MIWNEVIKGKYIDLRAVTVDDAKFIIDLRNDELKNQYIHTTSDDVDLQKEWIRRQICREGDYYFVICGKDGSNIGLASVYNLDLEKREAEFGRWISWGNALQNSESVILAFDFAFKQLGVDSIYVRVMKENRKVINFWKHFGGKHIGEVFEMDLWLDKTIVTKEEYFSTLRQKTTKLLRYQPEE